MKIAVLLINYDSDALSIYIPLLANHGIAARPATSMQEALMLLAEGEYSGIAINADSFDLDSAKCGRITHKTNEVKGQQSAENRHRVVRNSASDNSD